MSACLYCESPSEAMTPDGHVCRFHAIEYYTGLVATGKSQAIIQRILDPDREAHEQEHARICLEWRATTPAQDRPLRVSERELIVAALEAAFWNQRRAAVRLGISARVIGYKIKRLGIQKPWPVH